MMATETGDAFERAADIEYKHQTRRQRRQGPLTEARSSFHSTLEGLLFLSMALAVHWYYVQRVTNWLIAHGVLIGLVFLGLVNAWGKQRVAEAELRERNVSD